MDDALREERQAFLSQVVEDPDDDAARLVYADWLEDHGDPRGEFIRVQCEMSEIDECHPRYLDLRLRSEELLEQYGDEWAAQLKQDVRKAEYRRGFIENITMRARAFLKDGDRLFDSMPVEWLRFNYIKGAGAKLAEHPALSRLRYLDLMNLKIPADDLQALLESPQLTGLRGLRIGGYDVQDSLETIARSIVRMRAADQLTELDLYADSGVVPVGRILAEGDGFPNLRRLAVRADYGSPLPRGFRQIVLGDLEYLKLRGEVTLSTVEELAGMPVETLKELDVSSMPAGGVEHLAERGTLNSIESLRIQSGLGIRAMQALFNGDQLQQCRSLELTGLRHLAESSSHDRFIDLMAAHSSLTGIRQLKLSHLRRGQLGQLLSSPYLQSLEKIELHESSLSAADIQAAADNPVGESLRCIRLTMCDVGSEALEQLDHDCFSGLLSLEIDQEFTFGHIGGRIEAAILQLLESSSLRGLQTLSLRHADLSENVLETLLQRSNQPELRVLNYDGNHGSNKLIFAMLESLRLPLLKQISAVRCRGLRRSAKIREEYAGRLKL